MEPVDLARQLARLTEYWKPAIVGELKGQTVRIAKFLGEFVWHHHEHQDELFLVLKGQLRIHLKDQPAEGTPPAEKGPFAERTIELHEGEFFIVPRGIEHCPVAEEEAHILLFEPAETVNTGNVVNERTVTRPEHL